MNERGLGSNSKDKQTGASPQDSSWFSLFLGALKAAWAAFKSLFTKKKPPQRQPEETQQPELIPIREQAHSPSIPQEGTPPPPTVTVEQATLPTAIPPTTVGVSEQQQRQEREAAEKAEAQRVAQIAREKERQAQQQREETEGPERARKAQEEQQRKEKVLAAHEAALRDREQRIQEDEARKLRMIQGAENKLTEIDVLLKNPNVAINLKSELRTNKTNINSYINQLKQHEPNSTLSLDSIERIFASKIQNIEENIQKANKQIEAAAQRERQRPGPS